MLAAVATAMPETLIPVIAILGPIILGRGNRDRAGRGRRRRPGRPVHALDARHVRHRRRHSLVRVARPPPDRDARQPQGLGRDVSFFIVGYGIAIGTAFLPASLDWLKWVAAVVLITLYAVYVWFHFRDEPESGDEEELVAPLTRVPGLRSSRTLELDAFPETLDHRARARMPIVVAQVALALLLIVIGAQVFVGAVDHLSTVVGLDPTILALIIAPIATELREVQ